ncbi:MAG: Lrp/AsnC family transcriptional regulator [Thermoproteota archaeon]
MLDEADLKIVAMLVRNARASVREIARELGLSPSSVHARLQRLVRSGVVKRFTAEVDQHALGIGVTAITLLQVEGGRIVEVGERLAGNPHVVAVYDITGEFDLLVISKFRTVAELDRFLKQLNRMEHVRRTVTSIALRVIKEDPSSAVAALVGS